MSSTSIAEVISKINSIKLNKPIINISYNNASREITCRFEEDSNITLLKNSDDWLLSKAVLLAQVRYNKRSGDIYIEDQYLEREIIRYLIDKVAEIAWKTSSNKDPKRTKDYKECMSMLNTHNHSRQFANDLVPLVGYFLKIENLPDKVAHFNNIQAILKMLNKKWS